MFPGSEAMSTPPQAPSSHDLDPTARPKSSARFRLRNYLLTGLIVAGPLAITMYITWSFITWVDGWVKPLVPAPYLPETYLPFQIPGFGLVVALAGLTTLGFLTANLVGKTLRTSARRAEPDAGGARHLQGTKQVFKTMFSQSGTSFRKVGLVEFPVKGDVVAGVHLEPPHRSSRAASGPRANMSAVFLPCAPNPTTGFFFYLPRAKVIELPMSVEEAAKLVMSAGRDPARRNPGPPPDPRRISPRQRAGAAHESARAERVGRLTPPSEAAPRRRARTDRAARAGLARARLSDPGRGRRSGGRRRGRRRAGRRRRSSRASRKPGRPDCRVPSTSPSPRRRRSSSAMRKPSSVSRIVSSRACAVVAERALVEEEAGRGPRRRARPGRGAGAAGRGRSAPRARSTMTVASGTSTPTSITVVETRISVSPRDEARPWRRPCRGLHLAVDETDRVAEDLAQVLEAVLRGGEVDVSDSATSGQTQ